MTKSSIGRLGEDYAASFLTSQNYQIIARNYHSRFGEIDIIAKKNHELIFVEVKTRTSENFGTAEEALTFQKREKILKTIFDFLNKNPSFFSWKVDLIAVKLTAEQKLKNINHLKNILDG